MSRYVGWPDRSGARPRPAHPASEAVRVVAQLPRGGVSALIVVLFAPLGMLTHASVRRFLLAVTILGIPFPVGIYLGNRQGAAEFGSVDGFHISVTTIALAGLYAPLLAGDRRG